MASRSLPVCTLVFGICLLFPPAPVDAQTFARLSANTSQSESGVRGPESGSRDREWRLGAATLGGDASVTSAYVWRGWVLDSGQCLQLDAWATVGDFTFTSWVSLGMASGMGLDEYDFTLDYAREMKHVTALAGWTNYNYKIAGEPDGRTNEFYVGFQLPTVLHPEVRAYGDVQLGDGTYVNLSANQDIPIARRLDANVKVSLGYNHHQWTTVSGWSDLVVTLTVSLKLPSDRMTLEPSLTYSHGLNRELFSDRAFGTLSVVFK